jgi:hypothetical protein
MIIFGWRTWARSIAHGTFFCPHCGADRDYSHKRARRWFTLFFIPVIPLNVIGEYIQCDTCTKAFKPTVLDALTTAQVQDTLFRVVRKAVTVLVRQVASPGAEAAALSVLSSFAGRVWTADELTADVAHLDTSDLSADLATLASVSNEHGKERILSACVQVAATGGVIDSQARVTLEHIAAGLLMTAAHARGVIDQAVEQASA